MMIPASTTQISSDTAALARTAPATLPDAAQSAAPGVAAKAATVQKHEGVRREQLDAELADANRKLAKDGNEVRFEYDRESSSLIVRLVDTGTKEILRQFPSNEALHAARMVKSGKPLISFQA
ncbi:MAG: flagellar protein FlaG [Burkholderiales bacterium]|nr:flagellar protein FlaG [Burkholderiales bacterium]